MKNGFDYTHFKTLESTHQDRWQNNCYAIDAQIANLTQDQISRLNIPLRLLVVAEGWCADSANGVPIFSRIASIFSNWEYKIALRSEHEELVNKYYLTAGKNKIPTLIVANSEGEEIIRWVEQSLRSYRIIQEMDVEGLLQEERLNKLHNPKEINPPGVSQEIFREVFEIFEKAAAVQSLITK